YDLLGWGRSHHLDRAYRLDDYLTNLQEILATLTPAPIVVASSLTAAMILRLATQKPEAFRALLLVAPSGLSDFGEDYSRSPFAQLISTPVLDRVLYTTAIATQFGIRSFLETRQFAQRDRINNEIIEAYLASAKQPNAEYSALSFVRGDLCFDLAEDIPQLTVPTAIFWGRQSQFTSVELGQRLATLNPQAIRSFDIIEEAGLTPQLEQPAVLIGQMRRTLRALGL
ncbi:MAG: alpha/beta hydrolase, partial [Cyanobacteria bacterium J06638_22]